MHTLPIGKGTLDILLRVLELVRDGRNGKRRLRRIHKAQQIEVNLDEFPVGIRHIFIDKRVGNTGCRDWTVTVQLNIGH